MAPVQRAGPADAATGKRHPRPFAARSRHTYGGATAHSSAEASKRPKVDRTATAKAAHIIDGEPSAYSMPPIASTPLAVPARARLLSYLTRGSRKEVIGKLTAANLLAAMVGIAAASRRHAHRHLLVPGQGFGSGPSAIMLFAGPGGGAAFACQLLIAGLAAFAAIHCSSRAVRDDSRSYGRLVAALWPSMALGITAVASGAFYSPLAPLSLAAAAVGATFVAGQAASWLEDKATFHSLLDVISVGAAMASLCFGVGLGLPAGTAVAHAIYSGAAWSVGLCAAQLGYATFLQFYPTTFIDNPGIVTNKARLNDSCFAPGIAQPDHTGKALRKTIHGSPQAILDFTAELKAASAADGGRSGLNGVPVMHLHGPPGSGKSVSARAVCQAVGADLVRISVDELAMEAMDGLPVAGMNAVSALLEANMRGRQQGRLQGVLFEEIDHFLPDPAAPDSDEERLKQYAFFTLRFTLQLLQQQKSHVFVITTTNHFAKYEDILRLLGQRPGVYVPKSSADSQRDIFAVHLANISQSLFARYKVGPLDFASRPDDMERLHAAIAARGGLSGRTLANLSEEARLHALVRRGERWTNDERLDDLFAMLLGAIEGCPAVVSSQPRARPSGQTDGQQPSAAANEGPSGSAPAANEAMLPVGGEASSEFVRQLQLARLRPSEVFDVLRTALTSAVDPSKSLQIAKLKLRLGSASVLTLLLKAQATGQIQAARDFRDVPDPAQLDEHGASDSPEAWQELVSSAQSSLALHTAALMRYADAVGQMASAGVGRPISRIGTQWGQAGAAIGRQLYRRAAAAFS